MYVYSHQAKKEQEKEKLHQQQLRKKDIYDTLQAKVSAI
jgi:hypothetical protein